jgi:hypothetical protein
MSKALLNSNVPLQAKSIDSRPFPLRRPSWGWVDAECSFHGFDGGEKFGPGNSVLVKRSFEYSANPFAFG